MCFSQEGQERKYVCFSGVAKTVNLSEIRTPAIYGHTKVIFLDVNAKFYALTLKLYEVYL